MKILLSGFCYKCSQEASVEGKKYLKNLPSPSIPIELNETGVYSFKCPKNHINWFILREPLFQILFDLGVLALSGGYTREAVSSFATSLERFYEFIIKLILLSEGADEVLISKYWNEISKQSERQFGGYISIFVNKFKRYPPILKNNWIQFRNSVLHSGKIPTEKETQEYGQVISDQIFDVLFFLKEYFKDDVNVIFHKVYKYNANMIKAKNPQIKNPSSGSYPTLIQTRMINNTNFKRLNLSNEVEKYKNSKTQRRISYIK